ncbi:hypothetical protein ACOSQ3_010058 [Xanthoceras sorbifolium]
MIFAPLIWVNHHGQSIVFACAFLNDETTDSFLCAPNMITTDQDPAMTKAIAQAFPNTYHIFFIYRDHYVDFRNCIWESYTVDEFESKWLELIENCKLYENGWFQSLYEICSKWVLVFKYVSKKNSLMNFILSFNRALAYQHHEELIADHTDSNGKPVEIAVVYGESNGRTLYPEVILYIPR